MVRRVIAYFSIMVGIFANAAFGDDFAVNCQVDPSGYAAGEKITLPISSTSESALTSIQARNLPIGLSVNFKESAIVGTPTKPGVFDVVLTARNAERGMATANLTIKIRNFVDPDVFPQVKDQYGPYVPGVQVNDDMSGILSADTVVSGLPAGMRWDKPHMAIVGAATKPGNFTVTFSRTVDRVRHVASATYVVGAFPVLNVVKIGNGNGTVSGSTDRMPANRKVQIRGTASPDSVFAGWYHDEAATIPLKGDMDYRTANYQYVMTAAAETTIYGRFIPKAEDVNVSFSCDWPAEGIPAGQNPALKLDVQSETAPKVTVKGAPAGIRFDAKSLTFIGAATKPGVYEMTITVANASGKSVTQTVVAKIQNYRSEAIPVQDAYPVEMAGVAVELEDAAFADCRVTGLPAGLKLVGTRITGVPTRAGNFTAVFTKGREKASSTFTVLSLPTAVVATYAGTVAGDGINGTATMTVSANGRISGKIMLGGTNWTVSVNGFHQSSAFTANPPGFAVLTEAKSGRVAAALNLTLKEGAVDGSFGGEKDNVRMWRTVGKDKELLAKVADYVGVYTVSMDCDGTGYGYLSMTVDKNGNVKSTGKMADGTALTATMPMLFDGENPMAILYAAPGTYKGGCVFDVIRFLRNADPATGAMVLSVEDEGMVWRSNAPNATEIYGEGFDYSVSLTGAWYNKLGALSDYYTQMAFSAELPSYWAKIQETDEDGTVSYMEEEIAVEPDCWAELTVSVLGNRFVVDQGAVTKPRQEDGEWVYDGRNDVGLSFAFTQATGIFKGSFLAWYDYIGKMDWVKDRETAVHMSKTVSFEGVAVQGASVLMRGFFVSDATSTYEDAAGNEKSYTYKKSMPVVFE